MNTDQEHNVGLPLRRNLTLVYALTFIIAVLMAAASVAGPLYRAIIYPTDGLLRSFLPTDVAILSIGLPILLGSMWLAWRGKLIGLLLWPGALFFVLYNYIVYVLAMPLNVAFLLHLALVTLSVYTLIGLVASIDGEAVRQGLAGAVPERVAGGVLAGLGLLFFLRVVGVMVSALASQTPIAETELALHTSDFLIGPAWVVCGALLWRRKTFGYVTGLGLLFQASMLFIGLIIFLLLQPFLTTAPLVLVDVVVVFAMGLVCFVPFALFVRGVVSGPRQPRLAPDAQPPARQHMSAMEAHEHELKDGRILAIREARVEDARAVLEYVEAASGETDFLTFGRGEFELSEAEEEDYLRGCRESDNRLYLLGLIDDRIVSILTFSAGRRSRVRHSGEFGMSVRQQYWRLGIGSLMIDRLIDWARATGVVKKINLRVRTDNLRAIALYEGKGFVIEGTLRREILLDGEYFDHHWMGLEL
jgi:RimJ/RimL family protein N-acetyltransferase